MKIVVASDLHGSLYYARQVLDAFAREQADTLLLLGDIYNHGPRNPQPRDYDPMGVAAALNGVRERLLVVKGNCDSEVDALISEFDFAPTIALWLAGKRIFASHGHVYNEENPPAGVYDLTLWGHFHRAFLKTTPRGLLANPGSVSLPHDGVRAYLIVTETGAELRELKTGAAVERSEW